MPAKTKRKGWKKKNRHKPITSNLTYTEWTEQTWRNMLENPIIFSVGFRVIEHNK